MTAAISIALLASVEAQAPQPAVPLGPISAIVEAFEFHDVVALGDPHGDEQAHAWRHMSFALS
jgi:hypothetical protein